MSARDSTVLLEGWLMVINTFHFVFTLIFITCIFKILFQKYSPYSQIYIASFVAIQTIWNGCPISEFVNMFNRIGGYEYEVNSFFFGAGGQWTPYLRVLAFFMVSILYWSAFETWYKVETPFVWSNYFKRGDFKMAPNAI